MKGLPRSLSRGAPLAAGGGAVRKLNISLDGLSVSVSSTGAAIGFGSAVVRGLPEGNIQILGAVLSNFSLAGSGADANLGDTWDGDFGIGTTPADDATITAGDVDLLPSTALGAATAEVSPTLTRTVGVTPTMIPIDNTDASLEMNLNVLIDAADIVDDQTVVLTASGLLSISYMVIGDD